MRVVLALSPLPACSDATACHASDARYVGLANYRLLWTDPVERGSLVHLGVLFCFYALIPTADRRAVGGPEAALH